MITTKISKEQKLAAILDEPPVTYGSHRDRLLSLAKKSQTKLAGIIRSDNPERAREALFVLCSIYKRGVARVLFDIVLDQNVSLYIRQRASFDSSSRITAEGRRKILDLLTRRSSDLDFVGKALLLEMIGVADSKRTAQLFLRLLSDKSEYPSVRVQAAKNIIDNFEDGLPIAVENALLEQLSDDSPQVRFACCMALSRSKNIIVTTSLEGLIQDRHIASDDIHSEVRGEVGACAKSAIDEIKARLEKRGSADLYGTSKPG